MSLLIGCMNVASLAVTRVLFNDTLVSDLFTSSVLLLVSMIYDSSAKHTL